LPLARRLPGLWRALSSNSSSSHFTELTTWRDTQLCQTQVSVKSIEMLSKIVRVGVI
jgi:hypothetical protein